MEDAKNEMRKFYSYERFDFDFVADASIFTKAEQMSGGLQNQVVITTPGSRPRASTRMSRGGQ